MKHGTVLVIVDCSAIQVLIAERSATVPHSEIRNPHSVLSLLTEVVAQFQTSFSAALPATRLSRASFGPTGTLR
jgi:hypothetical protein